MNIPFHCPYCDRASTRKWNLSTHIRRKHPGKDDPFYLPNKIFLTDPYYQHRPPTKPGLSNSFWPRIDFSDPKQVMEKLGKYNNLLEEIQKLSKQELIDLLFAIFNFPQFKS